MTSSVLDDSPPEDHVDRVVVERVLRQREKPGRPMTRAERLEVVRRLLLDGKSRNEIAGFLNVSDSRAQQLVIDALTAPWRRTL